MVSMKIMGPLILGLYLAIVAFAQDDCIGDYNNTLCKNSICCESDGFTCDMSSPANDSNKERCLWVCSDNDECEESLSGTQCDTFDSSSGVCRFPCKDDSDCGSDGFCATATEGELTAGLCYPCTQDGGKCNTSFPEWCCSGTCNTDGKCAAKPSAGVSLFDRAFSPKLLVGFAVLMTSACFL